MSIQAAEKIIPEKKRILVELKTVPEKTKTPAGARTAQREKIQAVKKMGLILFHFPFRIKI